MDEVKGIIEGGKPSASANVMLPLITAYGCARERVGKLAGTNCVEARSRWEAEAQRLMQEIERRIK